MLNYDEASVARGRARSGPRGIEARAWSAAYQAYSQADAEAPLEPENLVRLGTPAELTGRGGGEIIVRAHQAFLARGEFGGRGALRLLAEHAIAQRRRAGPRWRLAGPRTTPPRGRAR